MGFTDVVSAQIVFSCEWPIVVVVTSPVGRRDFETEDCALDAVQKEIERAPADIGFEGPFVGLINGGISHST